MQKRISAAEPIPLRVVIVTMDTHLASSVERARRSLRRDIPGLSLVLHAATEFSTDPEKLARCRADIGTADILLCAMLFMEDHFQPVLADLAARRDACDALVCMMSATPATRLTRVGAFSMDGSQSGPMALLKRLRGGAKKGAANTGAEQMRMLKRLPKILRFIPGTAQDVRAYFLTLQYWLAGSDENVLNMIRALVDRYADGPRRIYRGTLKASPPVEYPEVGVYHPRLPGRMGEEASALPGLHGRGNRGTVGVLGLRSYMLAGNAAHYDGVIDALEARGLTVIPAFASGLDARPAIERYFLKDGVPVIDALVSLTGFSLVGGPAYNDAAAAEGILARLDVPYIAAHPAELQTLEQWGVSDRGLLPVEATMMVAIPELDGATGPMVFGGRSDKSGQPCRGCHVACVFPAGEDDRDMHACVERAGMLAARVERLVRLRRSERGERKVGIVLFNFPPNAGNTGTAAYLSVFASLHNTLTGLRSAGYTVTVPESADALREAVIHGNAARYGATANVHTRIPTDSHVRRERHLSEIEAQWGPAPGRQQSDGASIFVLGAEFGNVFVGIQPAFGYEGDPMRLLFEKGFAPTHAFSAFYRWLREDFRAHALIHFGTHGALEFMPGRQTGLSAADWPDRLIGDVPNIYLYAANNPSEGALAKRRSAATLVSYLTPPIAHAGLYRGLVDLKGSIERWRGLEPEAEAERADLAVLIQAQAAVVELAAAEPAWSWPETEIARIGRAVLDLEYTLIPHGLHVVGAAPSAAERIDMLLAMAESTHGVRLARDSVAALVAGASPEAALRAGGPVPQATDLAILRDLATTDALLGQDHEIPALLRALDARFVRPAPGGDLLRTPAILPTGRNLHGFDPFRIPSAFAVRDGAAQAQRLLDRHLADGLPLPRSIAIVLWGTDNLKNEGGPIAQVLALLGTKPRFDGYGRLAGAELIPVEDLGRPRIDVVITLSGIFRDLLPLQIKLLAEACLLAASADEPVERNFVRLHALEYQRVHGGDLETAALRVFGNAEGAYGSNVNHLIENGRWDDEDDLAETYSRRKGFAYGRDGRAVQQTGLLKSVLADVELAYQNLDSVELGVTTVDHYFDTLGGISRAVKRAKGGVEAPVYIGDQTRGAGCVRSLTEQVALETRTRILNPKWYEGMLAHGYEGVRQIETHVTNTMGWSATTAQVDPWVYREITATFVLDPAMRERMAALNPTASAKVANRLIEAHERGFWQPDPAMLDALRDAGDELEDRLEGITAGVAA
ncbi:magnesium chelatase subunit H [Methylobacterium gossipiicola]|uniref:magnesium chelatase n=1 Tax=Methylobacterium gossipiicola TaxID=582675 RepID=A0A1I2V567_9HYPH|nr:magnesium chelatase subunit H [Methylobacterium gossipiicola]SFG84478.1 cobaltochelatase CobN subunit [Methylobacterium gossipiicola]